MNSHRGNLEAIKPAYGKPIDAETYNATLDIFEKITCPAASVYALYHRGVVATPP